MSRLRSTTGLTKVALSVLLLAGSTVACEEDSKTAPDRCADPMLQIYDIQAAGAPADDNRQYNQYDASGKLISRCVTEVGHAVSEVIPAGGTTATAGTGGTAGTTTAGNGGTAGTSGVAGTGGTAGKGGSAGTGGN